MLIVVIVSVCCASQPVGGSAVQITGARGVAASEQADPVENVAEEK